MIALENAHMQGALRLSTQANWNQTCADWKMMMAAGNAIGMVTPDGRLVASALTLPYGNGFGWISMVLVAQSWRKRGLATKLLGRAIKMLEQERLIPVLDATPTGEQVYRPLGFEPHFSFRRWEIDAAPHILTTSGSGVGRQPIADNGMGATIAYDRGVFGADRGVIFDAISARSGGFSQVADKNGGFISCRDGRVARQIGPLSAESSDIAINLLDAALAEMTGPVFIDVCDHQHAFVDHLKKLGFRQQRSFLRMAKGRQKPFGEPERMFAMAGPELG